MYGVGSVVIDKSDNLMIQYRRRPICSVAVLGRNGRYKRWEGGGGRFVVTLPPLPYPTRGSTAAVIGRFALSGGGILLLKIL